VTSGSERGAIFGAENGMSLHGEVEAWYRWTWRLGQSRDQVRKGAQTHNWSRPKTPPATVPLPISIGSFLKVTDAWRVRTGRINSGELSTGLPEQRCVWTSWREHEVSGEL
jgi:hypothetical protein